MKQYFLLSLLLLTVSVKAADTYTYGYFTYKIKDASKKEISLYTYSDLGEPTSLDIPSEIVHDGVIHSVTEIYAPSAGATTEKCLIQPGCNITDIFIPSSIKHITRISYNQTSLKYAIFENGSNISMTSSPIYFYNATNSLDYLIVFNNNTNYNIEFFFGSLNKDNYKENSITINYNDQTTEKLSLFLHYIKNGTNIFDNTTFNYIISALQRRGIDLNTISSIDLTKASASFTYSFETNPANVLAFGAQVLVRNNVTFTSCNIPDKVNFTAPVSDITSDIIYSRNNTLNWNSVCLPFDIKESDFGEGNCKIYTVSSASETEINLSRVAEDETLSAGTPCFIYSNVDQWNLSLSNVTISSSAEAQTQTVGYWQVIGSFTSETIGAGNYKLNGNGTEFGPTSDGATVTPFRCYIAPTSSYAPPRLTVNLNEEADITLVPDDAAPQKVKLYDLMGRHRKEGTTGLFIKSKR